MLEYRSLLLALGVSSFCLLLTMIGTWTARREQSFLLSWVVSLGILIIGIVLYSLFTSHPSPALGAFSCSISTLGFGILHQAAVQFRKDQFSFQMLVWKTIPAMLLMVTAFLTGYGGLGFILYNFACAVLIAACALEYWRVRAESPGVLIGMSLLYLLTGFSFLLCAVNLAILGAWHLAGAPSGWAETVNIGACIAGMTGIGGLSLTLNQSRITAHHRQQAMTDGLTGLFNRRALFECHEKHKFYETMAVMVLDIDHFKSINDRYGHAAGDKVICRLAELLKASLGVSCAARIGGEEFAIVMVHSSPAQADVIAERIRRQFQDGRIDLANQSLQATVSIGIAHGTPEGLSFDDSLKQADLALYAAKRKGRNRVERASSGWQDETEVKNDCA
ncbi:GGDEF domain-containing protein [Allorhizobium sp. BGMRC 0089]|uniref:GGDEF domain-containing protein n=1 Tax=Allorhizobium sonneratiae TaxID=2934936 RepID=UPI002034143B|nr:GGDEF domain-containing protein [Allorhizobium sonneratiae]MCM2291522.1 GGDEF domain-containing protein [Allorhizobium sonneratiae]